MALKKLHQIRAERNGFFKRAWLILAAFVKLCKICIFQHNGGIDPNRFRFQFGKFPCRCEIQPSGRRIQIRHHLQAEIKAFFLDQGRCVSDVFRRVAAHIGGKNFIVHILRAEFNGGYAVFFEQRKNLLINEIRSCGDPDAGCLSAFHIRISSLQQREHIRPVYCGKRAAEKRDLIFESIVFI